MKKILAWALVLLMVVGLFAGCTNEPKPTDPTVVDPTDPVVEDNSANLASALEYLETMYKTVSEITGKDFTRPSSIPFGLDRYDITWTTNTDEVKVVDNGDGTVTIDVNEEADEDTPYELTATLTASNGKTVSYTWKHLLPKAVDVSEIFNEAFALADGESMGYEVTLTGVVTMVNTAYSPDYKNVTVTIEVPGYEGKAIQCYRMKGDGADEVGPGWTITVTGTLTNYKGTVQFGAGCIMDSYVVGEGAKAPEDPLQIVKEAYELAAGASLPYNATLTGIITAIDTPYDPGYGNVSVTIAVAGAEKSPILCYRMKGTGADNLYVGDVITVKGLIKNYNGTIEFDAGCQLLGVIAGERVEAPTDPYEILDAAYALKRDESLPWPVTLSGIVTTVDTPYDAEYNNITVTITLPGANDQPIKCFRMKGDGIAKIKPSDTITVTGVITNYEGEREFKAGCKMIEVVERGPGYHAPETQEEIVEHIKNLPITCTLLYKAKLTGEIVKVNSAYSSKYGNITVTIGLKDASGADFNLKIYRLKGNDIDKIKKGDTITVEGYVTHYVHNWEDPKNNSELEMVNATLVSFESGSNVPAGDVNYPTAPTTLSENKAYKLVMIQGETEQVLVFDGGINSSSYLTTTTDSSKYVDVFVEKESDGYRFYFMDGNVKKYIELYINSSNKVRPEITETPDQVWKYDAASKLYTITLTVGSYTDPYYLGTYSNYNTISSSSTFYVTGENAANYGVAQFAAILMEEVPAWDFGGGSTTPDPEPDPEPETGLGAEITNPNVDPTASLKVVIYAPAYAKALSTQKTGYNNYYNLGVDVAAGDSGLTGYSDTEVWDVIDNGDGTYSFANGGKKIGLAASNSSMNLDAVNDTWTVEALGGGLYNLKNVGRGNYMEWYAEKDNWSTYGSSSAATDDQFQLAFYVVAGTLPTFGGGTTPDPEPEDPTPDPEPDPEPETPMTEKEIVDAAFALTGSESLDDVTLTGTIVSVDTAYDSGYKNITVTMEVEGTSGKKTLKCFRLTGDDLTQVAALKVTDTITVNGSIVVYSGNPQFGQGCKLTGYVAGPGEVVPEDALVIVIADIATENSWANSTKYDGFTKEGVSFTASCTNPSSYGQNTGKYYTNGQNWRFYQNENPSLVIDAGTKTIATIKFTYGNANTGTLTYGGQNVATGSVLEVNASTATFSVGNTGTATNGNVQISKIEITFAAGGTTPDPDPEPDPEPDPTPDPEPELTEKEIVDAAFALTGSESLDDVTLTGTIISVDTAYDSGYKNITVTMEVEGTSGKKTLKCYRLTGDDLTQVAALKVTDTITVNGNIVLYNGNPQFGQGCKLTGYVEGEGVVVPEGALAFTIADIATENSWSDTGKYTSFTKDGVTFTVSGTDANTGKYYVNGYNWRLYQTGSAKLVIDAGSKTIASVKVTYTNSNNGVLTYNGSNVSTGTVITVNASSVTLNVGNTGTATNGQARITAIEITFAG